MLTHTRRGSELFWTRVIRNVISSYVRAYESLNPDQLRELVSEEMLADYSQWSKHVRTVRLSLTKFGAIDFGATSPEALSDILPVPRSARITADLFRNEVYKHAARLDPVRKRVTISMVHKSSGWVIASIL